MYKRKKIGFYVDSKYGSESVSNDDAWFEFKNRQYVSSVVYKDGSFSELYYVTYPSGRRSIVSYDNAKCVKERHTTRIVHNGELLRIEL
jgi:hypothetical protein